jgi:hypothetical protein
MPTSVTIGLLVLASVLLLVAILGGNFKLFGAEISGRVSHKGIRWLSGILGLWLLWVPVQASNRNKPEPQNSTYPSPDHALPKPTSIPSYSPPQAFGPTIRPAPSAAGGSTSRPSDEALHCPDRGKAAFLSMASLASGDARPLAGAICRLTLADSSPDKMGSARATRDASRAMGRSRPLARTAVRRYGFADCLRLTAIRP